jgi:hypothetical protein
MAIRNGEDPMRIESSIPASAASAAAHAPEKEKRSRRRDETPRDTPWLRVPAIAAYAGGVGRRVVYSSIRSGQLRAARLGSSNRGVIVCHVEWVDAWISSRSEPRPLRIATR